MEECTKSPTARAAEQAQELSDMLKKHSGCENHQCAPRDWRATPNISGDYDFDATLQHRHNKDLPHRLELYVRGGGYHRRTGYTGYRGTDD